MEKIWAEIEESIKNLKPGFDWSADRFLSVVKLKNRVQPTSENESVPGTGFVIEQPGLWSRLRNENQSAVDPQKGFKHDHDRD